MFYGFLGKKCAKYCFKVKGIFIDSYVFTLNESEDTNKKSLFSNSELIQIFHFQVMHDYVCFIALIDYCVE